MMTSKEWVEEQLSYTDDHWTTSDRIMLTKILKDLERLEVLELSNKTLDKICETQHEENEKLKKIIESNFWTYNKDEVLFRFNENTPVMQEEIKEVLDNE